MLKKRGSTKVIYLVMFILFVLYSISLLLPLLIVIMNSFKTVIEFSDNIWSLPKELFKTGKIFINYITVANEYDFVLMFANTIILTIGGVIVGVLSPTIVAYVLAKYKFKLNYFLYSLAIIFMVIPNIGTTVATSKLFYDLNLMNSHFGVLCLYAAPFNTYFFLLFAYFKGVSSSYSEAAKIDGANDFTVFFKIMLPLAKNGLAAIALLVGLNCWNDYFTPYMYMPDKLTLSTGLQELSANLVGGNFVKLFAAIVMISIPAIVVFLFNQTAIIENVNSGGIKG